MSLTVCRTQYALHVLLLARSSPCDVFVGVLPAVSTCLWSSVIGGSILLMDASLVLILAVYIPCID